MKKLVNTPLTNTIWWATVNEEKGMITGNKVDVTDNAIQAALNHLMMMDGYNQKGFSGYTYDKKNGDGNVTIAAYDETYVVVKEELLDELKEYKSMYEGLSK